MSRPVIVLLHGAWHTPSCFDPVVPLLASRGYEVVRPALPSSGADPPEPSFDKDVSTIRSTVEEVVARQRNVVVVMHSYSGIPGGNALEGLEAKDGGWGVTRLVYINSFLVPEGFQHSPAGTRDGMVDAMLTDLAAGTVTVDPDGAKAMMYQDLSDEEVKDLVAKLKPQSIGVFWSKTTSAAWRFIPTTYVICKKDSPSTVAAIDWLIETAKSSGEHRIDKIINREVGHFPFLSQPEWTANMLINEAETSVMGGTDILDSTSRLV